MAKQAETQAAANILSGKMTQPKAEPAKKEVAPVQPVTQTETTTVVATTPQEPISETVASLSTEEILKRASQVKEPEKPTLPEELKFYSSQDLENMLTKVTDPELKKAIQDVKTNMEKGLNEKFMKLASERQRLEAELQAAKQPQPWTPERLQQEITKPDFIQSAQAVQRSATPQGWEGTENEWSSLSEKEKSDFTRLQNEVASLRQQQFQSMTQQEDEKLKSKYPDYEPTIVSSAIRDLYEGRRAATREDIWKVINHDRNVQRAYEMGKRDAQTNIGEKAKGSSTLGVSTQTKPELPVWEPDKERHSTFLSKIMKLNMEKQKLSGR